MKRPYKPLRIRTAGYSKHHDAIIVDCRRSECGDIRDGVAFTHEGEYGWVMRYADLMRIADAATKARKDK